MVPQVSTQEAKKFSGIWNYKGVVVPFDDAHIQFATDFANVVLRSYVNETQKLAAALMEKLSKSKIIEGE